jgi:RNA polymerase-binding transcription factor
MTSLDETTVRGRLLAERERLLQLRIAAQHVAAISAQEAQSRPLQNDTLAETAAGLYEMEKDIDLLMRISEELLDVTDAMQRVDDGTYGVCEMCGEPIDPERLAVMPAARRCVADDDAAHGARRAHVRDRHGTTIT